MLNKIIESPDFIEVGEKIREHRKALGLSQCQLGDRTNLSNNTVSRIESAQVMLSAENLFLMAEALGVTPNDISPSRLQHKNKKPSLSHLDEKFCKLSHERQRLVLASVSAMIDGFLLSPGQQ